jgi:hypothetical protein
MVDPFDCVAVAAIANATRRLALIQYYCEEQKQDGIADAVP